MWPRKLYATSLTENGGRSLTLEQMVELAKRLAYYTSQAHREVGGRNQVAIFKKSQTVSIDQPTFPEPQRPLFRFSLVVDSHFSYSSVAFAKGSPAVFVRCSWVGMQHDLPRNAGSPLVRASEPLTRESGVASTTRRPETSASAAKIRPGRQALLGRHPPILVRMATIPHRGHAGNRGALPQGRIPFVLEADFQGQEARR